MTKPDTDAAFDLHVAANFFDAETCREIIAGLRRSPVGAATVYGQGESGSVHERVRKTERFRPAQQIVERVRQRLLDYRGEVGEHFGISLADCEEPQFLRYRVGDFFVAHQDGNTGLLRLDSEQSRKVSIVIFLNRQSEVPEADAYCGGSLVFSDWHPSREHRKFRFPGEAGMLVAFRAETTHEVIPVTHGERFSIASWYR